MRTWLRLYGSACVFLCATASQSSSALDPRRRDLARTEFTSQTRTSALGIPQQVIARIGLRPFVRIGAIDALGEIAAHTEIDGNVDHPGTPAGKSLFECGRQGGGIVDARALRAVGMGERDVVG